MRSRGYLLALTSSQGAASSPQAPHLLWEVKRKSVHWPGLAEQAKAEVVVLMEVVVLWVALMEVVVVL